MQTLEQMNQPQEPEEPMPTPQDVDAALQALGL
jgi:hypothetical protein